MKILVQVIYSGRVEQGGAAPDTMHYITFVQQELGQIGTILPGDAGYQSDFLVHYV